MDHNIQYIPIRKILGTNNLMCDCCLFDDETDTDASAGSDVSFSNLLHVGPVTKPLLYIGLMRKMSVQKAKECTYNDCNIRRYCRCK